MKYDLKDLTIEEKLKLLTGKDEWRINDLNGKLPEVFLSDGPNGLRKCVGGNTVRATAMPNVSVLANSWDKQSAFLDGATIADDCINTVFKRKYDVAPNTFRKQQKTLSS